MTLIFFAIPEELFSRISDGVLFSHIVLSDPYLQIDVDHDSKELLTILTHKGLNLFNRLSFEVKINHELFNS